MFDPVEILVGLSKRRPVFHSEADFQHAFAWEIHQMAPAASLRLEFPFPSDSQRLHLDIWVAQSEMNFAFELKYKTRKLIHETDHEQYILKDHTAQDKGRYAFIHDIWRLERIVSSRKNTVGYAVLLTNDSSYWNTSLRSDTVDSDFRLDEGRVLQGTLDWGELASEGTKKGQEQPISLDGRYDISWHNYSQLSGTRYTKFRFLPVRVGGRS